MTKKDYTKIADVIHSLKNKRAITLEGDEEAEWVNCEDVLDGFITMLQSDNPRFNPSKFTDYINRAN